MAGFGCPTMKYSNQDASRNKIVLCKQANDYFITRPPPQGFLLQSMLSSYLADYKYKV